MQTVAILIVLLAVATSAAPSQHEPAGSSAVSGQVSSVVQGSSVQANAPSSDSVQPASQQHPSSASYYAPAGLVTVVGEQGSKPMQVRNFGEQYGQPEPASLPANYKPFGSWGLYIGGNPADGYYSNYYKALSSSVEKQQQQAGEPVKPTGSQTAAFSPILKQAGPNGDYYPFAYSPSELSAGVPVPMSHMSPVQAGVQAGYGPPAYFDNGYGQVSAYADSYATKKMGAQFQQKEASKEQAKGQQYQSPRVYVYPAMMAAPAPMGQPQSSVGQPQVVSYAVPVGSQIVGSQPGLEGAFNPYGVHAFTRYAVKPMVGQEPGYYYGGSSQSVPYKQQQQQVYSSQPAEAPSYPMGFYGYPMSQLHYSQAPMPAAGHGEFHHGSVSQVEPVSDKSEVEDKVKPQKRA